jgi:hypothetical protein
VSIWYQNLPPGKEVKCRIGPVKALPMLAGTVKDPAITINGVTAVFPGEFSSGSWLECDGPQDCILYGSKGETLGKVSPSAALPTLHPGPNQVRFSCAPGQVPSPRVKVTVFTQGETL